MYDRRHMRARGVAIIVFTLLLAGCGSGSKSSSTASTPSASTSTAITGGGRVTGRDGGFTTVLPTGFTDVTSRANTSTVNIQLAATAPRANGFSTNINVIRSQVQPGTQVSSLTDREITVLKRQLPSARSFSAIRSTTVAGQPGRELDYLAAPLKHVLLHINQVFVINNNFAYTITFTALPAAYSSKRGALSQLLSAWHWM